MQDFHLLSQLRKWIALHHTPLWRRAEGRTCSTSVDSGDPVDRLDLEQEKECAYICHSPMQGEHSRKGPKRCTSAGSQRKGNHDCGVGCAECKCSTPGFSSHRTRQSSRVLPFRISSWEVKWPFLFVISHWSIWEYSKFRNHCLLLFVPNTRYCFIWFYFHEVKKNKQHWKQWERTRSLTFCKHIILEAE